eukprot:gene16096-17717_t
MKLRIVLGVIFLGTLVVLGSSGKGKGKRGCKKPEMSKNVRIAKIRYRGGKSRGKIVYPGTKLFFKCEKGFVMYGKDKIKCKRNRKWTHNPPECIDAKIRCPEPEPITNGTVRASRRVLSNAHYKCIQDYEVIGQAKRKCLPTGKWAGSTPKCMKKRCKKPRMLAFFKNGKYIVEDSNFEVWSTITFDCNEGYYMSKEDSMTCTGDATWEPRRVPKCYRINCGNPGRLNNGMRFGSDFTIGKNITYDCNYGYSLIGPKTRTCQSDFTWSGDQPVCDNKKHDCPDPGVPSHGRRLGNRFNMGDTVQYYCLSGYSLRGSETRKCIRNSTWTGLPAVCDDDSKFIIPPLNETIELFQNNFVDRMAPVTCSSNKAGKCQYPKYRGRSINLNHPNGLDLVFLFDASTSIGLEEFKNALNFACYLIQELGVDYGVGGTRVAAITFSTRASLAFNLGDERVNTVDKACKALKQIHYSGGGTGTRYGLKLVLDEVKPLFYERSEKALILIADGQSNFGGNPESTARVLKDRYNVEIFVFGVGKKVNKNELRLIASTGKGKHVFELGKYSEFRTMTEQLIHRDYGKCGEGGVRSMGRILGGTISKSDNGTQWPWQVAVYKYDAGNKYFKQSCGGSLIRDNIVLTAAHCILNAAENALNTRTNTYRVIAGELKLYPEGTNDGEIWIDEKAIRIKKIYVHQKYNPAAKTYNDDIALLELATAVKWSPKIRPICLPTKDHRLQAKMYGYVSGWGNMANIAKGQRFNKSLDLRYVSLPIQSNKTCGLNERKLKMFCAGDGLGEKDSCRGDSGGPFAVNQPDDEKETKFSFKVMGIVSHGLDCGTVNEYGYYTRVTNYLDWIDKTIKETKKE